LTSQGLLEEERPDDRPPGDLTRDPPDFPLDRPLRLQSLARADEGFLLSMAYSTQRGYGPVHPFVGELRLGRVEVEFTPPELGFAATVGEIEIAECRTVNQFKGDGRRPPMFTGGYGLIFGHGERKALSMAIVDRALRAGELGETVKGPAQDEEFVIAHGDSVQASGFVEHIKLPHYVDFQAELTMLKGLRAKATAGRPEVEPPDERPRDGQPSDAGQAGQAPKNGGLAAPKPSAARPKTERGRAAAEAPDSEAAGLEAAQAEARREDARDGDRVERPIRSRAGHENPGPEAVRLADSGRAAASQAAPGREAASQASQELETVGEADQEARGHDAVA
jgi:hypothetical protein